MYLTHLLTSFTPVLDIISFQITFNKSIELKLQKKTLIKGEEFHPSHQSQVVPTHDASSNCEFPKSHRELLPPAGGIQCLLCRVDLQQLDLLLPQLLSREQKLAIERIDKTADDNRHCSNSHVFRWHL